jgi:putative zinc finger/helix-turn-helix YgiT family protein
MTNNFSRGIVMANGPDFSNHAVVTLQCPQCGSNKVLTSIETQPFTYGRGTDAIELTAEIPVRYCSNCGFEFLDQAAEELRHEAVCRYLRVMTPEEVSLTRKKYNLSRNEFSKITRIGEASLARWEAGSLIQSAAYDQYLYLLGYTENLSRLYKKRAIEQSNVPSEGPPQSQTLTSLQVHGFRMITETSNDLEELIARKEVFQLRPHKRVA